MVRTSMTSQIECRPQTVNELDHNRSGRRVRGVISFWYRTFGVSERLCTHPPRDIRRQCDRLAAHRIYVHRR